jgi:hypothetical protein
MIEGSCQGMKTATIIWDFDGTLLPFAPYDSEQTLMLYKLDETAPRPPCFVQSLTEGLDIIKNSINET